MDPSEADDLEFGDFDGVNGAGGMFSPEQREAGAAAAAAAVSKASPRLES